MASISASNSAVSINMNVVVSGAGLDALKQKGADLHLVFAKLAMDTASRAALNIRAVGAIDTSYMVNTTAARDLEASSDSHWWSIGTAAFYGVFVEFGTRFMPARPWLTPAMAWAREQVAALLRANLRA